MKLKTFPDPVCDAESEKNYFQKSEKRKRVKISHIFGKDVFFDKIDIPSVFRNFRRKGSIW